MTLEQEFQDAAKKSRNLPSQSNETLLKIYGLYKQASEGDVKGSRPGMFDMRGRAKYDAWAALKGTASEEAKQKYVDLINQLGG